MRYEGKGGSCPLVHPPFHRSISRAFQRRSWGLFLSLPTGINEDESDCVQGCPRIDARWPGRGLPALTKLLTPSLYRYLATAPRSAVVPAL